MHGERVDAPIAKSSVERDGMQDVGGERVVFAAVPVGIVQIDVAETMALGGEVDDDAGQLRLSCSVRIWSPGCESASAVRDANTTCAPADARAPAD